MISVISAMKCLKHVWERKQDLKMQIKSASALPKSLGAPQLPFSVSEIWHKCNIVQIGRDKS
jgi:hypothetical protein